jgi:hypothetical protein
MDVLKRLVSGFSERSRTSREQFTHAHTVKFGARAGHMVLGTTLAAASHLRLSSRQG